MFFTTLFFLLQILFNGFWFRGSSKDHHQCKMTGCVNTKAHFPGLHFFKFPITRPAVCQKWVFNCANEILDSIPEKILRSKLVCQEHFSGKCFISDLKTNRMRFQHFWKNGSKASPKPNDSTPAAIPESGGIGIKSVMLNILPPNTTPKDSKYYSQKGTVQSRTDHTTTLQRILKGHKPSLMENIFHKALKRELQSLESGVLLKK